MSSLTNPVTSVALAGLCLPKNFAYVSFMSLNIDASLRKTVVFATSFSDVPAAFRTAFRLASARSVCYLTPPLTIFPDAGAIAIIPETKTRPFTTTA